MRKDRPVIVGSMVSAARKIVLEQAEAVGARVILSGRDFRTVRDITGSCLQFEGMMWSIKELVPGLKGQFQLDNAACALASLEILSGSGFEIRQVEAARGIESAWWPGRLQVVKGSPPIIVDAAHNRAAVKALVASLDKGIPVVWLFSALSGSSGSPEGINCSRVRG
jgi:dihydrofolate synthase/folylpolyglutamate synthase